MGKAVVNKSIKKDKPIKERTKKYEEKLAVNGTFADVFKVVKKNKEDKATNEKK